VITFEKVGIGVAEVNVELDRSVLQDLGQFIPIVKVEGRVKKATQPSYFRLSSY